MVNTVNRLSEKEQYARWNEFKDEVLYPLELEMRNLIAPAAQAWNGDCNLPYNGRVFHIHNIRTCSFSPIPLYSYISSPTYTTVNNHYYAPQTPAPVRSKRRNHTDDVENQEKKEDKKLSTAAIIAIAAACIVGILYTGYQMAHSVGQTLSATRRISKMEEAYESLKEVTGLSDRQREEVKHLVAFRKDYLAQAASRSKWDIAEDVAIIAGLALVAVGVIMGWAAPAAILGGALVIAAIITKFVTHKIWPNLEDNNKLKKKAEKEVEIACALKEEKLLAPIQVYSEPQPPSEPYIPTMPLYPKLDDPELVQYMANFYHTSVTNIQMAYSAPAPSAPTMDM